MRVAIGADHAAYDMKREIIMYLEQLGHEVKDFSPPQLDPEDDYPDVAVEVSRAVADGSYERGVLVCGTGVGMSMTANKVKGVRAALCGDTFSAHSSREHNNANVLCLGSRVLGVGLAKEITKAWFSAEFSTEARHGRRVEKMDGVERSC